MQEKKLRFVDKNRNLFFPTVKSRVDEYFRSNNLSKHANGAMIFKSIFFVGGFIGLYALILSGQFHPLFQLMLAILLGAFAAFIGFNVCHDAIHGAYSANQNVNRALSYLFNLIGANFFVWQATHNVIHHTYTNVKGHDEDIEIAPGLLRVHKDDKINWIQRFQHIYAFPLYGLASLAWVFRKDYVKIFSPNLHSVQKPTRRVYFELFFFKAVYYFLFIVLPLMVIENITWWQFIIGFVMMHISEGLVLGLVFQLAHVVEDTTFPEPDDNNQIEASWAVHQMETTANFSRKSKIATFLCGGLNMQVEHHLFPRICHIHYPALSEIVRKTALEFDVAYNENPTFLDALKSHYRLLRRLGIEEQRSLALKPILHQEPVLQQEII
jgi:linoleoyl-CoA desaturase